MRTVRNSSHLWEGGSLLTETFQPEGHNRRPPHQKASPEGHNRGSHQKALPEAIPEGQTRRPFWYDPLVWPSGVVAFCYGLLVERVSVRRDPPVPESLTRRPYQKAIPEGHNRRP